MKCMDAFGGIQNHRRKYEQEMEPQLECGLPLEVLTMVPLMWAWDLWLGQPPLLDFIFMLCLKQASGPTETGEINVGAPVEAFHHPVTYSYCLTPENSPPRQVLTQWIVWALAQASRLSWYILPPVCLWGDSWGFGAHFPSLAASCNYWLAPLSLELLALRANAVTWADVRLARGLPKSARLSLPRGCILGLITSM